MEFWKFCTFTPLFSLQPIDCPCSDCGAYIDSLNDRQTEENNSNGTTAVPESTLPTPVTPSQKEYLVVDDSEQTLVKVDGSVKLQDKVKQKGCGFQIINGNITRFLIYCKVIVITLYFSLAISCRKQVAIYYNYL